VTACIVMSTVVGCHHLPPGPQRHTCTIINPAVGCHYFPPGPQLPSQPSMGPGHPSSPLVHLLPHLFPFYFSLSFIGFNYFLLLSILSLSTRIVPLCFQAGGRRRRPNLGLVCVLFCNLCYLYSLVNMDGGVLFCLV